jgi:hypothetical protein
MGGNELEAVVGAGDLGERHPNRAIQFTAGMRLGSLKLRCRRFLARRRHWRFSSLAQGHAAPSPALHGGRDQIACSGLALIGVAQHEKTFRFY